MHPHFLVLFLAVISVNNAHANTTTIAKVIPPGVNIENYPDAKKELIEHLDRCGPGVVESIAGQNRCSYTIRIDDNFLKSTREKTGFLYDPHWPYEDGIQWEMPTQLELANVPRMWDLSGHGKMIRITDQQCGDCWAQASRANLEQLILSFEGLSIPLSTQTLISSCCNTGTCGGGYMTTPSWVVKNGLPIIERDPYRGTNSSCKFNFSSDVMDHFMMKSPYVGDSLRYSRAIRPTARVGSKIRETQALMIKYRSNAVVTIQAIQQSSGVIKQCSAINSGGNHMQNVVGWYEFEGDLIARVQNSWGKGHGQNGYTHIKWECGNNQLNRGLGRSARVGIYAVPCSNPPEARTGKNQSFKYGKGVRIGHKTPYPQKCSWVPKEGLSDPSSCNPIANPKMTTEYHLSVETSCGKASAMTLITPLDSKTRRPTSERRIRTPLGVIDWPTYKEDKN